MSLLNKIIAKLGKKNYKIDERLTKREIVTIVVEKTICLVRGFYIKLWLKKSKGLLFVGQRCKLKFLHKVSLGRTVTLGDNVEINALSVNGIVIGNNVSILRNTIIECTGNIKELGEGLIIGDNVGIAQNCFLQIRGKVNIGSNVMFGPNVYLFSENHGTNDLNIPMIDQKTIRKGVTIENDVWVGSKAVILDGVTIGQGSIIAAGAVVNRNVPAFSIVGGVPAKVISSRK